MGKIVLLDDLTINKIAAGEVIERPASVVKEVMENSIDAGASKITVEIRNGGISYIRITDDGKGIMQDDLEIAFERHATSKLRSADDLNEIKSMGFRGEALASIAAIAKVTLVSKTADSSTGYEVIVEGGNILSKKEAGCPNGTSITIENLFFNTPVRYKFLKKDFTESGYIEDVVTRIALVHPEIAIKLINSGKTVIQTSGNGDIKAVIYNIYGKEIAENLINVDYDYEDIKIKGVIGKPVISRSNRSNQLFFVNDRYVKDKTLSGAAEQAFKGFVTVGKHGFLVLDIKMDPKKVDVNVHPAKLEVRFQEENIIFKAVYHAIKEGLLRGDLVADTESIDGLDNIKTRYNEEPIKPDVKVETTSNSQFRDILNNSSTNNMVNKMTTEQKTEETFEQVMAKLKKMQDVVKMAKGEKVEQTDEQDDNIEQIKQEKILNNSSNVSDTNEELTNNNIQNNISNLQLSDENNLDNVDIGEQESKNNSESVKIELNTSDSEFLKMYEKNFGIAIKPKEEEKTDEMDVSKDFKPITGENISVFEEQNQYNAIPTYKFIGIAFNTYIIIEMNNDLYIIDQHAAHERIMYEKIKANYYNENEKNSQLMLLPDIITLTHKEMGIYKDNKDMFKKAKSWIYGRGIW